MYVRIFQICLMGFVVATCYINVGKETLDDGECARAASLLPFLLSFFFFYFFLPFGGSVCVAGRLAGWGGIICVVGRPPKGGAHQPRAAGLQPHGLGAALLLALRCQLAVCVHSADWWPFVVASVQAVISSRTLRHGQLCTAAQLNSWPGCAPCWSRWHTPPRGGGHIPPERSCLARPTKCEQGMGAGLRVGARRGAG